MTKRDRQIVTAKKVPGLWKKYLKGEFDLPHGDKLPDHSVMYQIQKMVEDDFSFRVFNEAVRKMSIEVDFEDYFSSNEFIVNSMKKWYSLTQCLYIRRLTDNNKDDPCSLMSLLHKIKKCGHSIDRDLFCHISDGDSYADIAFDTLSGVDKVARKPNDKISEDYIGSLIKNLEMEDIKIVRDYVDKAVAHSDFEKPQAYPSMNTIKNCHEVLVKIYKELDLNFFLVDSTFGEVSLHKEGVLKEGVLKNADKPFLSKKLNFI